MPVRKKYAFLVGISKYIRKDFQTLTFAVQSIDEFENILKESAEFEEIVVLKTKSEDEKNKIKGYDYTAPNATNIQEKFDELLKKIGDHDLLIIYFLCHGGLLGGENCIFPENMSVTSPETLKKAVIPLSDLEKPMRRLSSQTWNVFFFLDICQKKMQIDMGSPEAAPKNSTDHTTPDEEEFRSDKIEPIEIEDKPSGISQFWACDSQHKAYTFKKGEDDHSIFSYALLKGLRKIPKPIKYGMLVNYVTKKVIKLAEGEGIVQVPQDVSKDRGKEITLLGVEPEEEKTVYDFTFTLDEKNILTDNQYRHIKQLKDVLLLTEPKDTKEYIGIQLYELLFKGDIHNSFKNEVEKAHNLGKLLRIKLSFENEELHELPWEFLYCDSQKISLATNEHLLFSRFFPPRSDDEKSFTKHEPPLKILIVVSQPMDKKDIKGYAVAAELSYSFESSDNLQIEVEDRPTPTKLENKLKENYDIIHFIGYAKYEDNKSYIGLLEENREVKWITETELIGYFKEEEKESLPILVVLPFSEQIELDAENSIYQNIDSFAINFIKRREKVLKSKFPTIITFRYPLNYSEALSFSKEFYKEIAEQNLIDLAVQVGRDSINRAKGGDHTCRGFGAPVLYTQKYGNIIEKKAEDLADAFRQFSNIDEKKLEDPTKSLHTRTLTPKEPSSIKSPQNPLFKKAIYEIIKAGNDKLKEKEREIADEKKYFKYAEKIDDLKADFKKKSKDPIKNMTDILMNKKGEAEDDNILEEIYQTMSIKILIYEIIKAGNDKLNEKEREIDDEKKYYRYNEKINDLKIEFNKITKEPIKYMTNILMKKKEEAEDDNILEEIYQAMFKSISEKIHREEIQ